MPYEIRPHPKHKGLYQVINTETGQYHAYGTTKSNAEKQVRLLESLYPGVKAPAKPKKQIEMLLAKKRAEKEKEKKVQLEEYKKKIEKERDLAEALIKKIEALGEKAEKAQEKARGYFYSIIHPRNEAHTRHGEKNLPGALKAIQQIVDEFDTLKQESKSITDEYHRHRIDRLLEEEVGNKVYNAKQTVEFINKKMNIKS